MRSEPIIDIQNVQHSLGKGALKKTVLTDINFSIYPGEIVLLTGPSGSGKTTLLTLAGGLRSIQTGSLKVLNQELNGANRKQLIRVRSQIGFIFQAHNLLNCLTAWENVSLALKLDRSLSASERKARSHSILEAVGLEAWTNAYPENLSVGQKQRVAIARALVTQPRLILADEPTAALDSVSGREVVDMMQQLAQKIGCAVLLVTHDPRILDIADRIIQMEDGRLLQAVTRD